MDTGLKDRVVVTPAGKARVVSYVGKCIIVRPFKGKFRLMVFVKSQVKERK